MAQEQVYPSNPRRIVTPGTALNYELENAVRHNDVKRVEILLNAGADASMVCRWEGQDITLALWFLADIDEAQRHTIFPLLAEHITDVNQASPDGTTLLATAADAGNLALVKSLVARGARVNQISSKEFPTTPLLTAVRLNNTSEKFTPLVTFLLVSGADPNLYPAGEDSPLIAAARTGQTEAVRALLAHGADPAVRDRNGLTALRWAATRRSPAVIALLRDISPLDVHEAAQFGVLDKVKERLDAGDDPNSLRVYLIRLLS